MLAQSIQRWVEAKGLKHADFLFPLRTPGGDLRRTSKMIKRDLRVAREKWINEAKTPEKQAERRKSDFLSYRDQDGLFADFHSARHTFVTNLGKAGVSPKLAQALARHSTINLTMNVYSHVGLDEKARAVASIPAPQNHPPLVAAESPALGDIGTMTFGGVVTTFSGEQAAFDGGYRPLTDADDKGEAWVEAAPSAVPTGAQFGALILTLNGPELASIDTEGTAGVSESLDLLPTPKSLLPETFGSEWHPLAPNATAPQMAVSEVRPEGFEPPTLGSED
jgi:hypothetical protein